MHLNTDEIWEVRQHNAIFRTVHIDHLAKCASRFHSSMQREHYDREYPAEALEAIGSLIFKGTHVRSQVPAHINSSLVVLPIA